MIPPKTTPRSRSNEREEFVGSGTAQERRRSALVVRLASCKPCRAKTTLKLDSIRNGTVVTGKELLEVESARFNGMGEDERQEEIRAQQRVHEAVCARDFQTAVTFWSAGLRPWDGSGDRPDPYELTARKFAYEHLVGHWDCPGLKEQPLGWSLLMEGLTDETKPATTEELAEDAAARVDP